MTRPTHSAENSSTNLPANRRARRRRVTRRVLGASLGFALLAAPAGADVFSDAWDWTSEAADDIWNFGTINKEGGAKPCNILIYVQGAEKEVPTSLAIYARKVEDPKFPGVPVTPASKATFVLDGTPMVGQPAGLPGQYSITPTFSVSQAGNHVLQVKMSSPNTTTCTTTQDVWVHPTSIMPLTAFAKAGDPTTWKLHAGMLVDWENVTATSTFQWSFGGGTATTPAGPWGSYPSDIEVVFPAPGPYQIKVTGSVMSKGRLVTLTKTRLVMVDGPQPDMSAPPADPAVDLAPPSLDPVPATIDPAATPATTDPAAPAAAPVAETIPPAAPTTIPPSTTVPVVTDTAVPVVAPGATVVPPADGCAKDAPTTAAAATTRSGSLLSWAYSFGSGGCTPVAFRLQVANDSQFATVTLDEQVMKTMYGFSVPPRSAPTAYWFRVAVVFEDGGVGPWSDRVPFTA